MSDVSFSFVLLFTYFLFQSFKLVWGKTSFWYLFTILWWLVSLSFFFDFYCHLHFIFWWMTVHVLSHFLTRLFCCWVFCSSYTFWTVILYQRNSLTLASPILSVASCQVSPLLCRILLGWCNHIFLFLFLLFVPLGSCPRSFFFSLGQCLTVFPIQIYF